MVSFLLLSGGLGAFPSDSVAFNGGFVLGGGKEGFSSYEGSKVTGSVVVVSVLPPNSTFSYAVSGELVLFGSMSVVAA